MQFLPRVGQEVLVQFLGNDIDRPIITGALYNGQGEGGVKPTPGGRNKTQHTQDQKNKDQKNKELNNPFSLNSTLPPPFSAPQRTSSEQNQRLT
jgi:uncharacterized protein involved in type VI secretion and phage assembly